MPQQGMPRQGCFYYQSHSIIDECYEIGSRNTLGVASPVAAFFSSAHVGLDGDRRKADSGVSFTSTTSSSSNRNSAESHQTRPSTSSTVSTRSYNQSKEKPLPEKPLPLRKDEAPKKAAGSTLERIAREIRKIKSRGDIRDTSKQRPSTAGFAADMVVTDDNQPLPTPGKERRLKTKLSLSRIRSNGALKERDINTPAIAPASRGGGYGLGEAPAFDVDEM